MDLNTIAVVLGLTAPFLLGTIWATVNAAQRDFDTLGKKALLHSDGDLNLLLDQIHATGIDGYQSIDPQGNMDIRQVREKFPDWILMGNVNSGMLQFTDREKIRQSVRYCMKHGGVGKPYIFSTSNCIFDGMPAESYRVMLQEYEAIRDNGKQD